MFGRKPDCFIAASMASRVFLRTDGVVEIFGDGGRRQADELEKSSIVLICLVTVEASPLI